MKCLKCGWPIPEDSEFCQYCGAKVEAETESDEITTTQQRQNESVMPQEQELEEVAADEAPEADTDENSDAEQAAALDTTPECADDVSESEEASDKEETAKSEEDLNITVSDNDSTQKETSAKKKQTYCKRCGGLIDRETKKCQGCGKQYFRVPKHLATIILAVFCVVLVGLNVFQYMQTVSTKEKLEKATATVSNLEKKLSEKGRLITDLRENMNHYESLWRGASRKAAFMDDYVVIVGDSNNRYHKYGCEDLDLSYFYVYNIDNAKAQGYRACSKCN